MLKKIASKSLNHMQNKECDIQCLICKKYSNTILYVCESGHFLCKNCSSVGHDEPVQERSRKNIQLHRQVNASLNVFNKTNKSLKDHDLASGDNEKIDKNCKTQKQEKDDQEAGNTDDSKFKQINTNYNDATDKTIIKYKNNNFNGSTSSIDSTSIYKNETIYKGLENNVTIARPVKCPVTTCSKMIAVDSTMQHFYFDHSKVANITLKPRKTQRIIQKSCTFTKDTQCICTFKHQNISGAEYHLLLMCATKYMNVKKTTDEINISITKKYNDTQGKSKIFESDEILLLWLCKIDNNAHSYKIALSTKDKLLSYSFAGVPINIRDSQDADTVYDKSNCLIVRGVAANRLLDNHNQFNIFVSIV
ncbi:uncharacterized protein LOC115451016 [Manduca sexta]|uniref:uncharacterized protein LOC115451016 n=1 Tax=Manduca sexta TaxID=7130 RepID=UPI00188FC1F1|nr:uncharacterized protein LOC115451016 [Manduca sexta]